MQHAVINFVVMTKDEPEAFRLLRLLAEQLGNNNLMVLDDFSGTYFCSQLHEFAPTVPHFVIFHHYLSSHFGNHRNYIKTVIPQGQWIVMLDADEVIMPDFVIGVSSVIDTRPDIDTLYFQRHNSYYGPEESPEPPLIDFSIPFNNDFQGRGFINTPEIHYEGQVHEGLVGWKNPLYLKGPPFCIIHHVRREIRRYEHLVKR